MEQEEIKYDGKTMTEVQREYASACAKLGDLYFRYDIMDQEITQTKHQLEKLNRTAKKFKTIKVPVEEAAPDAQ